MERMKALPSMQKHFTAAETLLTSAFTCTTLAMMLPVPATVSLFGAVATECLTSE